MKKIRLIFLLLAFGLTRLEAQTDNDLQRLAKLMQGSFSSAEQAKSDSAFYSISLKIIPIWSHRTDGIWMYVEQAMATNLDKPYRQRVYRLSRFSAQEFESAVYTLVNPLRFAGKPELLANLNPDSLSLREGCSVFLKAHSKYEFSGSTGAKTCPSDLRGASYASSEVVIDRKKMISWDRGYDAEGKQVWGAVKSGYVFKRLKK